MNIFNVLLILIILFAAVCKSWINAPNDVLSIKRNNNYLKVISFILIVIAGLRGIDVGLDTDQYYAAFSEIKRLNFNSLFQYNRWELGYLLLNWLIKDTDFVFLQILTTSTLVGGIVYLAKKYSPYVWLSCLLFVINSIYYRCFNEMRQTVSMGILCFAFIAIVDKKIWRFIILTLIASFFHRTCLIFLPTVLLIYIDEFKTRYFLVLTALLVFTSFYTKILFQYSLMLVSLEYETKTEETGGWGFFILNILTMVYIYKNRQNFLQNRINVVLTYILFITLILFPICHLNPTFFRLSSYFGMFSILLIPRIRGCGNNKTWSTLFVFVYCCLQFFYNYFNMYSENNQLIPYKFFWE